LRSKIEDVLAQTDRQNLGELIFDVHRRQQIQGLAILLPDGVRLCGRGIQPKRRNHIRQIRQPREIVDQPPEMRAGAINIQARVAQILLVLRRIFQKFLNLFLRKQTKNLPALIGVQVSKDEFIEGGKHLRQTKHI